MCFTVEGRVLFTIVQNETNEFSRNISWLKIFLNKLKKILFWFRFGLSFEKLQLFLSLIHTICHRKLDDRIFWRQRKTILSKSLVLSQYNNCFKIVKKHELNHYKKYFSTNYICAQLIRVRDNNTHQEYNNEADLEVRIIKPYICCVL